MLTVPLLTFSVATKDNVLLGSSLHRNSWLSHTSDASQVCTFVQNFITSHKVIEYSVHADLCTSSSAFCPSAVRPQWPRSSWFLAIFQHVVLTARFLERKWHRTQRMRSSVHVLFVSWSSKTDLLLKELIYNSDEHVRSFWSSINDNNMEKEMSSNISAFRGQNSKPTAYMISIYSYKIMKWHLVEWSSTVICSQCETWLVYWIQETSRRSYGYFILTKEKENRYNWVSHLHEWYISSI